MRPMTNSKVAYLGGVTAGTTWQDILIREIQSIELRIGHYVDVIDTRRDDWGKTVPTPMARRDHTRWEYNMLRGSDFFFFAFTPESSSVMPLFELTQAFAAQGAKMVIYIHPDYPHKEQVESYLYARHLDRFGVARDMESAIKKFKELFLESAFCT